MDDELGFAKAAALALPLGIGAWIAIVWLVLAFWSWAS